MEKGKTPGIAFSSPNNLSAGGHELHDWDVNNSTTTGDAPEAGLDATAGPANTSAAKRKTEQNRTTK
jgi:hypothetical protein